MPATNLRPVAADAALAFLVGLVALGSVRAGSGRRHDFDRAGHGYDRPPPFVTTEPPDQVAWLVIAAVAVAVIGLAIRRLRPRLGYALVVAGTAAFLAGGGPYGPVLIAPALAVFSLAGELPVRRWAPLTVVLPVMISAGFWRQPYAGLLDPGSYVAMLFGSAALVSPALIGLLHRSRREADARERAADRRRSADEERLRIAREVHDVVGHSLSVIHLQAGVALHVLDRQPEQAATSLDAIRRTSGEALAELRSTLAMFRAPQVDPTPGLDRLDALVAALRAAGRTVRLDRLEVPRTLPAAVDHAVYRIIQEALTNVVRHGGDGGATVTIRPTTGGVLLEVTSEGRPVDPGELAGGSGIAGMHERAAAVGGRVSVAPRAGGGVTVTAELPLPEPAR